MAYADDFSYRDPDLERKLYQLGGVDGEDNGGEVFPTPGDQSSYPDVVTSEGSGQIPDPSQMGYPTGGSSFLPGDQFPGIIDTGEWPGGGSYPVPNLPKTTEPSTGTTTPTETPSTETPSTSTTTPSGGTGRDWFMEWTKGKTPNKETLLANEAELKAHGYTLVPNKTLGPDGKPTNYDIMDSNGRIIDVIVGGSRGGEAWQYDDSGGGPAGGGAPGGYGTPTTGSYQGFGSGPVAEAIQRLLARGEKGVSAQDPNIAGPTSAFRAQAENATRKARTQLAERAAAAGLNSGGAGSGALDTGIQSQLEQEGRDVGSYQAGLMVDEIKQQRQDVLAALQFAQGEERLALQHQLAMMNEALARAQMAQQNNQWYDAFTYGMSRDARNADTAAAGGLL